MKSDPRAILIVNGDIMNTALKSGPSDLYGETVPPGKQIDRMTDILAPLAPKIAMGTIGNHEFRVWRDTGIDIMSIVFANIGLSDKYVREGGMLYIRLGQNGAQKHGRKNPPKQWYSVYVTHGSGGGRKEGAKAIRLADMASIADADIYIHSHTHMPMIMRQSYFRADPYNCCVRSVDRLFVNTGACLEYGGYGQMQEYKPASQSTPVITILGTQKAAYATL